MSETVGYKGRIIEWQEYSSKPFEERCMHAVLSISNTTELPGYYDSWEELIQDQFQDYFAVVGGKIYELKNRTDLEPDSIFEATENQDGSIDFVVQYYNGGCCFWEALEEALKNVE